MPSKSQQQQKFFGLVDAYQKGETNNVSPEVKKAADSMTRKEVRKFTKTKRKGLPKRVKSSKDENVERFVGEITESIMQQIRSKYIYEDETDKPMDSNVTSSLGQENKKPAQQKHGTWIYASMHIGDGFSRIYHNVLIHTARDYNDMEYVHKTFPLFSGYKYLEDVDFLFDIDTLSDVDVDNGRIYLNGLSRWHIVPENIAKALVVEMKRWNDDTIKRDKISGMFRSTLESVGRKVPDRLQK